MQAIPNAVSDHILKEECNAMTATLVSPNGMSWDVRVYIDDMREKLYFGGEGWLQFVHAHNLGLGYFLVFCYEGNMMFNFRVYDLSACETTSYASIELNKKDVKEEEDEDEEETKSSQEQKQKFKKIKFGMNVILFRPSLLLSVFLCVNMYLVACIKSCL